MKFVISLLACLTLTSSLTAQKFTFLKSDFSLIEKYEGSNKQNKLIMGAIEYDSRTRSADFFIKFPEKEKWDN